MKLGWGPEEGSGGEKRSHTARPTSELTVEGEGEKKVSVAASLKSVQTKVLFVSRPG